MSAPFGSLADSPRLYLPPSVVFLFSSLLNQRWDRVPREYTFESFMATFPTNVHTDQMEKLLRVIFCDVIFVCMYV